MTTNARLRAFVELADTGSVRAAARRLVVTESSVSSAITLLAAEVGVPLLDRDGRGVRLTPAGERYAAYARRILGLHDEAVAAARGAADPEHGSVRIAAVTTAGEHLLPDMLASFRAAHPHVGLGLDVGPRGTVWPMLAHHEVDVVVAGRPPTISMRWSAPSAPTPSSSSGRPAPLRPRTPGCCASTTRASARPPPRCCPRCSSIPPTLTLGSHGAVVSAAVAGLGVTLASRQAVRRHLEAGALVELPVEGTPMDRPWHVVTQRSPGPSTELLVAHLLATRDLGWSPASTMV